MNQSFVLDFLADEDLTEHKLVKKTSTGVAMADTGENFIGTVLRPCDASEVGERIASVHLKGMGSHYVQLGDGTDVAVGDELEVYTDGTVIKQASGVPVGIALEAATLVGQQFRAYLYPAPQLQNTATVVAAGIHSWAGGAATTDSISVVGLAATDVVIATLTARASTETLVLVANDHANDQIDLTLSANGTDTTTKVNYLVLRPV